MSNPVYSLSESRGGSLFVEGAGLPVLMLDFACGRGRVLLVYDGLCFLDCSVTQ
jgi:hypothetical protein